MTMNVVYIEYYAQAAFSSVAKVELCGYILAKGHNIRCVPTRSKCCSTNGNMKVTRLKLN